MRFAVIILFLSVFVMSNAVACLEPWSCFHYGVPSGGDASSLESVENNLKSQQTGLQTELTKVNQQLQSLHQFLSAQKALKLDWVSADSDKKISNSLEVSYDGNKAILCRAKFLTGTHPGIVSKSGCLITYGGYAIYMPKYEVLVGKATTQWKSVDANTLQQYQDIFATSNNGDLFKQNLVPIQAGFEGNIPLYVCKANYNNSVKLGKVNHTICNIPDGDKEITVREFDVLFGATSS